MSEFLRENWRPVTAALLLHVGIAALVVLAAKLNLHSPPQVQLAIQATVVDASKLRGDAASKRQAERERQEAERAKAEEAARRQKELEAQQEAQRQAQAEEQKQDQEKQKQQEEAQKQVEQQRQAAEQQKQADAKRQAEVQKQAQAAEAQRVEAARKAEQDKRAAAEKDRLADIARKQKEEADRQKAAADAKAQAASEADLRRQMEEEEGRAEAANSGLLNQYVLMIEQRIVRNWNRPMSAQPGLECRVKVAQAPGGTVLSVQVDQCNGDAAVRQSIEAAVYRSSPLPAPPDPRLFDRNLIFVFKPLD